MVTWKATSALGRRRLSKGDSVITKDREGESTHSSASVKQRAHSLGLRCGCSRCLLCFEGGGDLAMEESGALIAAELEAVPLTGSRPLKVGVALPEPLIGYLALIPKLEANFYTVAFLAAAAVAWGWVAAVVGARGLY